MEFILGVLVMMLLLVTFSAGSHSVIVHDDTDPPGGFSGLVIHTDERSGCQYLSTGRGGLRPRLDREGKHICRKG